MVDAMTAYEYSGGPFPTQEVAMSDFRFVKDKWLTPATNPEFFMAAGAWYWYVTGRSRQ